MLTELSKVNAPSMLLQDFNYFFNKAINQYINKRYNIYDVNQQTTDDLRVLKATTMLDPMLTKEYDGGGQGANPYTYVAGSSKLFGATYEVILPDDYLHMLNCVCIYKLKKNHKCYDKDNYVQFAAKRLTADSWSVIVNDYYNRPLPERPYYYIHNVNTQETVPTNPLTDTNPYGTDLSQEYKVPVNQDEYEEYVTSFNAIFEEEENMFGKVPISWKVSDRKTIKDVETFIKSNKSSTGKQYIGYDSVTYTTETADMYKGRVHSNFPRVIHLGKPDERMISTVEKDAGTRYGNASKVRCEIRYGKDNSVFVLEKVFIDYIKAPQTIRLTQEQVDLTEDTSQIMEFPDYVCQEIINELVTLVMENTADPRLQSHPIVTQSIANPVQQQTPQPQPQPQQRRG